MVTSMTSCRWRGRSEPMNQPNATLRYGITDIRLFYENDVRFLRQF